MSTLARHLQCVSGCTTCTLTVMLQRVTTTCVAVFDGGQIAIEGMSLISSSVELLGVGTATWPELELDLRLRSRATRRIPVLSELLESIRDEFVTIAVTGTAAEPKVSVQSLPETRRVIGRVLGFDESAGDRRLSDLEARAEKQRRLRGER